MGRDNGVAEVGGFNVDLEVMAELSASIHEMKTLLKAIKHKEGGWEETQVIPHLFRGVNVCPSPTASFTIDCGGPVTGYEWEVRRLIVGGVTWGTSAAGSANVFQSPGMTGFPNTSVQEAIWQQVDHAGSLPATAFYSSGQIVLTRQDKLFVEILSGTASQQYAASGFALVVPDRSKSSVTAVS